MSKEKLNSTLEETFFAKNRILLATIGVLAMAMFLYFVGLGSYPLLDPDEGRYAEIPREMLESGDFITPRLNYVKYFEKPPLFYWLTAGSMALFGQKEWAVRLVPAVAGFLTLLLIMGLGKRIFDGPTGVMAAWIYLTSVTPTVLARLPIIDGVFSLFLTATWGAWWLGYKAQPKQARRLWYCISWACLGLAVMTKGIAAIALTGLIAGGFILCRRDWRALLSMAWIPGLLIFAVIVVPWHWAVSAENPGFFHFYIVVQHFARLVSHEHAKPFWFFMAIFPFGMLLWTAFFFPAAAKSFRKAFKAVRAPRGDGGAGRGYFISDHLGHCGDRPVQLEHVQACSLYFARVSGHGAPYGTFCEGSVVYEPAGPLGRRHSGHPASGGCWGPDATGHAAGHVVHG